MVILLIFHLVIYFILYGIDHHQLIASDRLSQQAVSDEIFESAGLASKLRKQKRAMALAANNDRYICQGKDRPVDWYTVFSEPIADGAFEIYSQAPISNDNES